MNFKSVMVQIKFAKFGILNVEILDFIVIQCISQCSLVLVCSGSKVDHCFVFLVL